MTAADQERLFGYNCDDVGFVPLPQGHAILIVNHEYTNPDLMFEGYKPSEPTRQ